MPAIPSTPGPVGSSSGFRALYPVRSKCRLASVISATAPRRPGGGGVPCASLPPSEDEGSVSSVRVIAPPNQLGTLNVFPKKLFQKYHNENETHAKKKQREEFDLHTQQLRKQENKPKNPPADPTHSPGPASGLAGTTQWGRKLGTKKCLQNGAYPATSPGQARAQTPVPPPPPPPGQRPWGVALGFVRRPQTV